MRGGKKEERKTLRFRANVRHTIADIAEYTVTLPYHSGQPGRLKRTEVTKLYSVKKHGAANLVLPDPASMRTSTSESL